MWAPQQAARARHRASLASNRRRGRRIRSGRLRTHYRVSGSCSSVTGAGCDGRLTLNGPPTWAKNRRKRMESPIFRGIGRHYVLLSVEKPGVCARRSGTLTRVESNRLVRCHRINFPRFRRGAWANTWRKLLPESGLAARMPCRLLSVIETAGPGNMRLDARYGKSAAREECAPRRRP